MLRYTGTTYGVVTIKQNDRRYPIQIREANCLCAFIHVRKPTLEEFNKYGYNSKTRLHCLYSFWSDEQHVKNILKDNGNQLFFGDQVISIKLNLFYEQSYKLLRIFTQAGYKVTCYCSYENTH